MRERLQILRQLVAGGVPVWSAPERIEAAVGRPWALDRLGGPAREMAARVREGVLMGTPEQAVERILQYHEAGADLVNVALRAPWGDEALEALRTAADQPD